MIVERRIFVLLNIWTGLKILLAGFLVLACSHWGNERSLDVFVIPILVMVACIQLPILVHSFIYTRKMSKSIHHDSGVL